MSDIERVTATIESFRSLGRRTEEEERKERKKRE